MIKIIARETLLDGKKEEALVIFRELVAETRKEAGCIEYALHESLDEPNVVAMIEAWESKEALDAHTASEHFKRLIPKVGACTAGPPRIEAFAEIL